MSRRRRRRSGLGKLLNSLLRDLGGGRDRRTPILGAKTNNKPWKRRRY